jgi:hypothetical protein
MLNVGEGGASVGTSTKVSGNDPTSCKIEGDSIACKMEEGMVMSIVTVGRS